MAEPGAWEPDDGCVVNPFLEPPPLGLKLRKTPSLLDLLEDELRDEEESELFSFADEVEETSATDRALSEQVQGRLKASNFSAIVLRIGSWQRLSRFEGDVTGKFYYKKRKLVYEFVDEPRKRKIEIQFDDITTFGVHLPRESPGYIEICVRNQPEFYRELPTKPRKHTVWSPVADWTDGQATNCSRHILHFETGTAGPHLRKLFACEKRLSVLAKKYIAKEDLDVVHEEEEDVTEEMSTAMSIPLPSPTDSMATSKPAQAPSAFSQNGFVGRELEPWSPNSCSSESLIEKNRTLSNPDAITTESLPFIEFPSFHRFGSLEDNPLSPTATHSGIAAEEDVLESFLHSLSAPEVFVTSDQQQQHLPLAELPFPMDCTPEASPYLPPVRTASLTTVAGSYGARHHHMVPARPAHERAPPVGLDSKKKKKRRNHSSSLPGRKPEMHCRMAGHAQPGSRPFSSFGA